MGTFYLDDDVQARFEKDLQEYNDTHAETSRSGFMDFVLEHWEKNKPKK